MQTLDEVIKMLEDAIDATDADCPMMTLFEGDTTDTLHYLKEYQSVKAVLEFKKRQYEEMTEAVLKQGQEREAHCQAEITRYLEAVKNCEAAENKYRQLSEELRKTSAELSNDPLTWDELKQMEGKPVWVEGSHGCIIDHKSWALISFMGEDDMKCQLYNSCEFWIGEEDYGRDWQAYRKERG